jgi:hypothetical protein
MRPCVIKKSPCVTTLKPLSLIIIHNINIFVE